MNNPNPNYQAGPTADLETDFDYEKFIDHVFDERAARGTEIRRWFEAEGFVDVKVRDLPLSGPHSWECLMLHGQSDECRNVDEVKALVMRLAGEMGCQVQPDEIWAVVWIDRIGAHFRLHPFSGM
jgi:hypothetical protein